MPRQLFKFSLIQILIVKKKKKKVGYALKNSYIGSSTYILGDITIKKWDKQMYL